MQQSRTATTKASPAFAHALPGAGLLLCALLLRGLLPLS